MPTGRLAGALSLYGLQPRQRRRTGVIWWSGFFSFFLTDLIKIHPRVVPASLVLIPRVIVKSEDVSVL